MPPTSGSVASVLHTVSGCGPVPRTPPPRPFG